RENPTFTSTDQVLGWISTLPSGPAWQCTMLKLPGCSATCPIQLIWHDAKEVVEDILPNPIFRNYMTFDPHVVMHGTQRV
ncbi:hypothetical protein PAXRUDRAFT_145264, partial [Paxillus rubicundulus Ve08.2h10]